SRRRHTRFSRDWSSDVCSSDLNAGVASVVDTVSLDSSNGAVVADFAVDNNIQLVIIGPEAPLVAGVADAVRKRGIPVFGPGRLRSEERRVGKERRGRGATSAVK